VGRWYVSQLSPDRHSGDWVEMSNREEGTLEDTSLT